MIIRRLKVIVVSRLSWTAPELSKRKRCPLASLSLGLISEGYLVPDSVISATDSLNLTLPQQS